MVAGSTKLRICYFSRLIEPGVSLLPTDVHPVVKLNSWPHLIKHFSVLGQEIDKLVVGGRGTRQDRYQ